MGDAREHHELRVRDQLRERLSISRRHENVVLSVHDDRVSILSRQAELGSRVDASAVRAELDAAGDAGGASDEETAEVKYSRALLRAAGDGS